MINLQMFGICCADRLSVPGHVTRESSGRLNHAGRCFSSRTFLAPLLCHTFSLSRVPSGTSTRVHSQESWAIWVRGMRGDHGGRDIQGEYCVPRNGTPPPSRLPAIMSPHGPFSVLLLAPPDDIVILLPVSICRPSARRTTLQIYSRPVTAFPLE